MAQYEVVSVPIVRIDFVLDGGTLNGMPNPDIEPDPTDPNSGKVFAILNGGTPEHTLGTPVKIGYTFGGWKLDDTTTYAAGIEFEYAVDENDDFKTTLTVDSGTPEVLLSDKTITLDAIWIIVPATAPTINTQPAADTELVYGYEDEVELVVGATPAPAGEEQTYQWYTCDEDGDNKVPIEGATGPSYEFPDGEDAGDYYFVCEVTNTREDNGATESVDSGVAKVTVKKRPVTLAWSDNSFQYDGNQKRITATVQNVLPGDTVTVGSYTDNQKTDAGNYTAIAGSLTGDDADNYTLVGGTNTQKSWAITNRVITVTALDKTITYGDAPSGGGYTLTGFVAGEDESDISGTVSFTFNYTRYGNIGTYTITPVITGLSSPNYTFRAETGVLTVVALPVVLSWDGGEFVYEDDPTVVTYTVSATVTNAVGPDPVTVTTYTNNSHSSAGSYTARATVLSNSNYTLVGGTGITNDWLIRKKQPTLEAGTTTVGSAGASVTIDYTYVGDGTVTAAAVDDPEDNLRVTVNPDGTLTIEPSPGLQGKGHLTIEVTLSASEGANYEAAEDVVIVVNLIDDTIAVVANGYSGVYDAAQHGIAVEVSNVITNPVITYCDEENGIYGPAITEKDVGTYTTYYKVTGDNLALGEEITGSATITITPRPIAITAIDHAITYGEAPGHNGYTLTGTFAGSENITSVAGGVTYTYDYDQYDDVGSYGIDIEAGGTESNNYDITWNPGVLLVQPKAVALAWTTTGSPFSYDGDEKSISVDITAGSLVNGDNATLTVNGNKGIGVNSYTATVTGISNPNYTLEGVSNITQAWEIVKGSISAPVLTDVDETVDGKNDGKIPDVDINMEYWDPDADNGNGDWMPITPDMIDDGGMIDLPPGNYRVRYKETENYYASPETTVTIDRGVAKNFTLIVTAPVFDPVRVGYTRPAAEPITITNQGNWDSTISSVVLSGTDDDKFTLVGSDTTVPEGGSLTSYTLQPVAGLPYGSYTVTITVTYNNGATATATVTFYVQKKTATAPDVSGTDETYIGDEDGKISGVDDTMEYSPDGGTTWIPIDDSMIDEDGNLTGLPPGDYLVRYKETDDTEPSPATRVTIGPGVSKSYGLHLVDLDFGTVDVGYARPDELEITITSVGNQDSSIYSITVSKSDWFELAGSGLVVRTPVIATVTAGGTNTEFAIQPHEGLEPGSYTATITVTYNDWATATAQVSFVVRAPYNNVDHEDNGADGSNASDNGPAAGIQTGDNSNLLFWILLLALSGGGIVAWCIWKKRKNAVVVDSHSGNAEVEKEPEEKDNAT